MNNRKTKFAPIEAQAMACVVGGADDRIPDVYLVEPSARHPRYFFVSHLSDCHARVDYSTKPIHGDFVEAWLEKAGLPNPSSATWRYQACEGVYRAGQSLHAAVSEA